MTVKYIKKGDKNMSKLINKNAGIYKTKVDVSPFFNDPEGEQQEFWILFRENNQEEAMSMAAIAAEAHLMVLKEPAICISISRYNATMRGSAGKKETPVPWHHCLNRSHIGVYRFQVLVALAAANTDGSWSYSSSSCVSLAALSTPLPSAGSTSGSEK